MQVAQVFSAKGALRDQDLEPIRSLNPQLILVFGSVEHFQSADFKAIMQKHFANVIVIGCTTAGEISKKGVTDNSLVLSGIHFQKARLKAASVRCATMPESKDAGQALGRALAAPDLRLSFVLSPGTQMNGAELVRGLRDTLGQDVVITGGLAGDGGAFQKTFTLLNSTIDDRQIVGLGIYGESIKIGCGSMGGWKPFGPARMVTRIEGNVLYELDGQPALEVYKKYLGAHAAQLPASGLRFPFAILNANEDQSGLIRTILGVDEKAGSLTFAGDIPLGGLVRLMHAESEGLIAGAVGAAEKSLAGNADREGFGILVSCVGRKIVMGEDIDDEIEAVKQTFGAKSLLSGFYSYGEICPISGFSECSLHNQTMTITWISEAA